jgi:hypothetical protein
LLIITVLFFVFLVIKVKSVYDKLISKDTIEQPSETILNKKELNKVWELITKE